MNTFYPAFIYLAAAVIAVPIARRIGLGSVLGYLLAGVLIGPYGLHLVGDGAGDVMHVAEFGVVMMLFVIGLELRPAVLWERRHAMIGMGSAQLLGTALVLALLAPVFGLHWKAGLAAGLILALSSTAIVLQSLGEKGLLRTPGGEASLSMLLFQDIAVIPLIAAMPLLATSSAAGAAQSHGALGALPAWQHALVVLGAIGFLIFAGRYLLRPFFRYIAASGLREMFTAATLLLVVGIVVLMERAGLSPALGAFLAGVLLAESEYRVQLETDIEPFKGLLLGLFFISVGATIDFSLVIRQPLLVSLLAAGLLVVKFMVLFAIGKSFKIEMRQSLLFALGLAGGGEFAFVLFSLAEQKGALSQEQADLLVVVVALSMAATPLLLGLNEKWGQPRFATRKPSREPDVIDENENPVILAGFGRFGNTVGRLLRSAGVGTTVLDHDPDQVETLRRFGLKSFYGDALRLDLLRAAGAAKAKLFIVAIDDEAKARQIVRLVQEHFPHLRILARAASRQHAYELIRLGLDDVYRETFGSAVDLSVAALRSMGMNERRARRAAEIFREHDEAAVRDMAQLSGDEDVYASRAKQHAENLLRALQSDQELAMAGEDRRA